MGRSTPRRSRRWIIRSNCEASDQDVRIEERPFAPNCIGRLLITRTDRLGIGYDQYGSRISTKVSVSDYLPRTRSSSPKSGSSLTRQQRPRWEFLSSRRR